jgi:hypothetical protein
MKNGLKFTGVEVPHKVTDQDGNEITPLMRRRLTIE